MLRITKMFNKFESLNGLRNTTKCEEAVQDFAYRALWLARIGNLYTKNSKGEIVRVSDGKKVQ